MLYTDSVGPTEVEAVAAACRQLRLHAEDIVVRSVAESEKGVCVRVEAKRSRGQEALDLLKTILRGIGIKAELFYIESFDKITINVRGPNLGYIIGKNGTTLDALETLVNTMHNNEVGIYKPVIINPGGYRESRQMALKSLVSRAIEAARNGEKVSLPAMCQRDRKNVHHIIKNFPGFRSRSFGEGPDRRVYIFMDEDEHDSQDQESEQFFIPKEQTAGKNSYGQRALH